MLDFGCGAGAREPVLQSWPAELSGFKGPSKVMSEVLRCIKESFRKNLKKYFFREKNFDRKKIFRKKKLEKNVLSAGSLAHFLNRLEDTCGRTVLEVLFYQENRKNADSKGCFAPPKIAA